MASKDELQNVLKEEYGINKNISQPLSQEECEKLLSLLSSQTFAVKLVKSFVSKNSSLGKNNALFGRMRNQAEKRLETLQSEYHSLEQSIRNLESSKLALESRKKQLEEDKAKLEADINNLSSENKSLGRKVKTLASQNTELTEANDELKKDNKYLKNLIDAIKLKLTIDVKNLLKYEDSELRKALVKWFKGTQG